MIYDPMPAGPLLASTENRPLPFFICRPEGHELSSLRVSVQFFSDDGPRRYARFNDFGSVSGALLSRARKSPSDRK